MDIIESSYPIIGAIESMQGGRAENQDFVGYADTPHGFLVVLCDGMGGGPGGRTASTSTVKFIIESIKNAKTKVNRRKLVRETIVAADQNILRLTEENPQLRGMGTTAVVLLINRNNAILGHVGDSRCYQFRYGRKVYRTDDHSMVGEKVRHGILTEEQARLSAESNIITRAVNGRNICQPDIVTLAYERGDRFMLCTDGIWGAMPEKELIKTVRETKDINGAAVNLSLTVDAIGKRQGNHHDNLTLAYIETKSDSKKKTTMNRKSRLLILLLSFLLLVSVFFNIKSCVSSSDTPEQQPTQPTPVKTK